MFIKRRITVLFSIMIILQISAQDSEKAKKLLDEVSYKISGYHNIYLDFKYTLDNNTEDIHQETRGNLTLEKDKYVLNYLGATRIFDGSKMYTIVPENEEITIETPNKDDENTISPSQMLTFYKKGYNYKWDIVQTIKGRKIQYIELKPIKENSEISKILLGIDIQTKNIYNLIEIGKNGTKTTITVSNFMANQPLSKNTFKFDKAKYQKEGYYISEF